MADTLSPLHGKVALVTGASRGLGVEITRCLIDAGATVVMIARDAAALSSVAADLGSRAVPMAADITDPSQVRELFAKVQERLGRLDILINNAALGLPQRLETTSDEDIQAQVQANLVGPMYCIRSAIPLMKGVGAGDIVSISSDSVVLPFPLLSIYAATKAGVELMSRSLRSELALDNIRVSVLRAGHIADTTFSKYWTPEQQATAFDVWGKTGHMALTSQQGAGMTPAVVAKAVLNMVTVGASGNMDLLEIRAR